MLYLRCSKRELCSFLELCSVSFRFVQYFAHSAVQLSRMPQKESSQTFKSLFRTIWLFPRGCRSFNKRSDTGSSAATPAVFDWHRSLGTSVGFVMLQTYAENIFCSIEYSIQTLHAAKRSYSTAEKESLAVVWTVQSLRPYLSRERFIVFTDHNPVYW